MMKKYLLGCLTVVMTSWVQAAQHQAIRVSGITYDVIKIEHLNQLELFLKNPQTDRYYQKFAHLQQQLPACATLNFAMNAGMYHADFRPVGLYIENAKEITKLNETTGFGNFFMQPNGVLAWNHTQAVIQSTTDYKQYPLKKILYATQSGPMLVNQGKINPQFLPDSNSLKIRNGVGVKDNQLYFVISQQGVSFYQFAQFFKQQLKIDQALYLDGSISSLYFAQTQRHDRTFKLGPIVAEVNQKGCK